MWKLGHYDSDGWYNKWKDKNRDNDVEAKMIQDESDDGIVLFMDASSENQHQIVYGF